PDSVQHFSKHTVELVLVDLWPHRMHLESLQSGQFITDEVLDWCDGWPFVQLFPGNFPLQQIHDFCHQRRSVRHGLQQARKKHWYDAPSLVTEIMDMLQRKIAGE